MITFSCHCGQSFSVGDELAGGLVQCPQCKRLNDVPRLSDLKDIDDQGIYKIDDLPAPRQSPDQRVAELSTAFTREHFDATGQPIDLRDNFADPRTGPVPLESLGPLDSAVPKYDPITGQLVESIDVKPNTAPDPATLPVAARAPAPAITAIDGIEIPAPAEALAIPLRLLAPMNLLVMLFIFLAHLLGQAMMMAIGSLYLILWPVWMGLHMLILAHYANVIDETGPSNKRELPAPMRHLDWHEDTFGPFVRFTVAFAVCYGPAVLLLFSGAPPTATSVILALSAVLALLGTIVFPAALLTTTTSGSLLNLWPDRLLAAIMVCGAEYIVTVLTWTAGGALVGWGTIMTSLYSVNVLSDMGNPLASHQWILAESALLGGIYFLHACTWHLGILYRKHHQRFPWLYQRHERTRGGLARSKGFPVRRAPRSPKPAPPVPSSAPRVQPINTDLRSR